MEPNGKEYDIYFENVGSSYVPKIVPKENIIAQSRYNFNRPTAQLLSFVGPDKNLYPINHKNENGEDVPVIGKCW